MPNVIPPVEFRDVEHGVLIDITVPDLQNDGEPITFHISNCFTKITYNSIEYSPLGGFLEISEIQDTLQNTANEISISVSAIPADYINVVLGAQIKGGNLKIYRVFFDTATQTVMTDGVHCRFNGYITNFAVQEDVRISDRVGEIVHTLTLTASSIIGILEHRIAGRRTNRKSYQVDYSDESDYIAGTITTDPSMDRIEALKNAQFDFGKKV